MRLSWNFVGWYWTSVRTIARSRIFRFRVTWPRNQVKFQKLEIFSQSLSACQSFRNFVHNYLSIVFTIARCPSFDFGSRDTEIWSKIKISKPFSAIICWPMFFKLCTLFPLSCLKISLWLIFRFRVTWPKKLSQTPQFGILSQPLSVDECFRKSSKNVFIFSR